MKALYEMIGEEEKVENQWVWLGRGMRKFMIRVLVFVGLVLGMGAITIGIATVGIQMGWDHNNVWAAGMKGMVWGSVVGAFWATRTLMGKK
jgi:hypothetical protein